MKQGHLYRLEIFFNSGVNWDLKVLAIDSENVSTLIPRNETEERHVKEIKITLLQRNYQVVANNFCCKTL